MRGILLINHYAGSPRHGMEFRPFYFAREWVRRGHSTTIVAASHSHLRPVNPQVRGLWRRESLDGVDYLWLRTPRYKGNGPGRILNMACFMAWLFLWLPWFVFRLRPLAVVGSSTYPLDMVPAWLTARFARARLAFEVHDLWPLSPMELGGMSPWHPFILVMQFAENFACRACDVCVSMLPKALDHLRTHGLDPHKFKYVPNGILPEEWDQQRGEVPATHVEALAEFRRRHPFLVGYVGTHGLANALETLLEAVSRLDDPGVGFVLVGDGPDKEALRQKAGRLGILDRVIFLPPVPKTAVPSLLRLVDGLYIGWHRVSLYRFGISANKLFDYMMAAKPIIQAIEAGNDPVAEAGCGRTIPPEDPDALVEAIRWLAGLSDEERQGLGRRGRTFVEKFHSIPTLARSMLKDLGLDKAGAA